MFLFSVVTVFKSSVNNSSVINLFYMCQHVFYYTLSPSRVDSIKNYDINLLTLFVSQTVSLFYNVFLSALKRSSLPKMIELINSKISLQDGLQVRPFPGLRVLQNIFERNLFLRIHFQLLTSFFTSLTTGLCYKTSYCCNTTPPQSNICGQGQLCTTGCITFEALALTSNIRQTYRNMILLHCKLVCLSLPSQSNICG